MEEEAVNKAINLIYLSPKHDGGKDQVALNLLKGLQDNGTADQYEVICWDYSVKTLRHLAPDAQYRVLKSKRRLGDNALHMLQTMYINTLKLRKIIKEDHIQVLFHIRYINGLFKLPTKTVMIPHDIRDITHRVLGTEKIPYYKYFIYKIIYAFDFKHADAIIAISNFDKQEITSFYPQYAKKVKMIYNPIISDSYHPKENNAKKYICAINCQYSHKNTITLIKAFEIIKEKIPYQLVLIGNIPPRVQYLKEYVEQHGLERVVHFTGFISDDKIDEILSQTALYVNPSLFEGFGMTAVEAMIKKIPALVSDIPVNREVTFGFAQYYDDLQNPEALAKAIMDCLDDPPTEKALEQTSEKLRYTFHYRKIAEEYHSFFLSCIEQ